MMWNKQKKHIVDILLLAVSYIFLFWFWSLIVGSILIPYDGIPRDLRPQGNIRLINDFFESHDYLISIGVFAIVVANILLLLHRIHKRKMNPAYVLQHTYVTNFVFLFLKIIFLFTLSSIIPPNPEWYLIPRPLYEVFLHLFTHICLIVILFLFHHKNITFGKKHISL